MKKLDFRNFSVPTGITRQTREVFDAREQIADLLYTRVSGIKAHRLAFKIFESTGETEFSDEETGMIHMAVERYCLPNVIDALNEILGGSETDKNELTQEELVQEVLDRVLQSSTGVEDLETVTSLSGVKSLPGEKDGKMVNVPLELIGKPASDAAARAEAAAKKAEGAVAGLEEKTQAATEAATKANEAAAKAENAAAKVEQTTAAAIGGATARFSSWMETGNVLPDKSTKPGGSVVYVADAGKFAYHMDSTLYGDWDVAGVPPAGIFMNADRTAILPDKLYLLGDAVYTGTGGSLRLLAYRHEVMSGEAYEALQDKDANTLYLIYEED